MADTGKRILPAPAENAVVGSVRSAACARQERPPPKICIVTGASRGIGRGIALVLSRDEGHVVYATARSEESLAALAEQVAKETSCGGKVIPCAVDHADDAAAMAFVERVLDEQGGQLDLLVNNAYGGVNAIGSNFGKMFWQRPLSVWDASHAVGLRSHYVMSALVSPSMVTKRSGLIVNISSEGGRSYLFDIAYGCGKACLDRMGADMASELSPHGVHVVTLWPGGTNTETTRFPDAESVEFSGRGIAALLSHAAPEDLAAISGKIIMTCELAEKYGHTDVDGKTPGKEHQADTRSGLSAAPPVQWLLDAKLASSASNDEQYKVLFSGGGSNESSKL